MSAQVNEVAQRAAPRTLAERLTEAVEARMRVPVTDREHAEDIAAAGGDASIERRTRPMTPKEIAGALDIEISDTMVYYLLTGQRPNPGLLTLQAFADSCDIPVSYLVENHNTPLVEWVEQDFARDRVRADKSLKTMADRINGLIRVVWPAEYTDTQVNEELAVKTGCAPEQIAALRAGDELDISVAQLQKLATVLSVTVGYLWDGVDAERIEQRLALLGEFGTNGVIAQALEILGVTEKGHQDALRSILQAFLQVEAMPAKTTPRAQ